MSFANTGRQGAVGYADGYRPIPTVCGGNDLTADKCPKQAGQYPIFASISSPTFFSVHLLIDAMHWLAGKNYSPGRFALTLVKKGRDGKYG